MLRICRMLPLLHVAAKLAKALHTYSHCLLIGNLYRVQPEGHSAGFPIAPERVPPSGGLQQRQHAQKHWPKGSGPSHTAIVSRVFYGALWC